MYEKELMQLASLRLLTLEFHEPEDTFLKIMELAETTLRLQRQALEQRADVSETRRKYKVFCTRIDSRNSPVKCTIQKLIQIIKYLSDIVYFTIINSIVLGNCLFEQIKKFEQINIFN